MMRLVLAACVLAVSACAPTQDTKQSATQETQVTNSAVPAPTPGDVATRITAEQNGQTVNVAIGQRFAVELVGVPTAGYVWSAKTLPAFVQAAGEASGNTTQAQSQPGFVGGNHWEVLIFTATAAGTGELVLEQRRPWESNEPANNTFRVTIVAR